MKKLNRNIRGITLIALVISIIVMLILAGVSIGMLMGENGILTQAQKAVKNYDIASEREYLEQNVLSVQLDEYIGNVSSEKLGKTLYDRNLDNSSIWDIIVEKSENKTYGTGWNYLGKGTVLEDYGETKYNWVVNYETGEIIQLEDESYNNFDYKSTIAVDNPLFNLDSANVGLDKASWGNNATLYYYDSTQYGTVEARKKAYEEQKGKNVAEYNSGYDRQKSENISDYIDEETGAFKFNGNNYIEIYNENSFDFSEGMTFEFYGKIIGQVAVTPNNEDEKKCCGLLGIWNGKYSDLCDTRLLYNQPEFVYRLIDPIRIENGYNRTYGEWGTDWNQRMNIGNIFSKDIYFVVTIENKDYNTNDEDKITQSVYTYIDGEYKKFEGWLYKDIYKKLIEISKTFNYIELGRCNYGGNGYPNWCYINGLCYSTRIYNKALSEEEVKNNLDTTIAFHKYIIDSKK